MKILTYIFLTLVIATSCFGADMKSGEDVIGAMYKKYQGKWYKNLTFVQKTTNYKPDGTATVETWYEALDAPGKLRIDIEPLEKNNGIIFADGTIHQFRDGKLLGSRP